MQIDAPEPASECFGRQASRILAGARAAGHARSSSSVIRGSTTPTASAGCCATRASAAGTLNVELVERGAAAPYFFRGDRGRDASELEEAAAAARAAPRGLWAACPRARLDPERALATGPR